MLNYVSASSCVSAITTVPVGQARGHTCRVSFILYPQSRLTSHRLFRLFEPQPPNPKWLVSPTKPSGPPYYYLTLHLLIVLINEVSTATEMFCY